MESLRMRFVGVRPLLMHNVLLADPMSDQAKALKKCTSKRKKTDEDYAAMKRAEWFGGLETFDGVLALSADRILGTVVAGARKKKLGKDVITAVTPAEEYFPLQSEAPKNFEKMFADARFVDTRSVVVGRARVMRTRPKLPVWSVDVGLMFDSSVIDRGILLECAQIAGEYCGIGDFRPRFGRFEVEEI